MLAYTALCQSALLDLLHATTKVGGHDINHLKSRIGLDLPIVCNLLLLNAHKRNQTCNHMLFRSAHSTVAGGPQPDPGTGRAQVYSFAFCSSFTCSHVTFGSPHASVCFSCLMVFAEIQGMYYMCAVRLVPVVTSLKR